MILNDISRNDRKRLSFSTAVSILLHVAILTIVFSVSQQVLKRFRSLEAIMVNVQNTTRPVSAEYQSQNDTLGGGDPKKEKTMQSFVEYNMNQHEGKFNSQKIEKEIAKNKAKWMTTAKSFDVVFVNIAPVSQDQHHGKGKALSHREKLLLSLKAQLHHLIELDNHDKKRLFIGITAQKTEYANYTNFVAEKIEAIGSKHFPAEAKNRRFKIIATISIKSNGHLEGIQIERTSGSKPLDQAAIRIIKKAFPVKTFSIKMKQQFSAIDMTRTIYFEPGQLAKTGH